MTRPQQAEAMICRMRAAGLPFAWFTADEEFGQNPGLRKYLEENSIPYVMAIPKNTVITTAAGTRTEIMEIPETLRAHDWQRAPAAPGQKESGSTTGRSSIQRNPAAST